SRFAFSAHHENRNSNRQNDNPHQSANTRVNHARVKQISRRKAEQKRRDGIKWNTETPRPVRLAPAEQEKRNPNQQHEAPKYGRRIFDHNLEAATSLCAEQNERQRNDTLQQQGMGGGSCIFVPSSKPGKRPKVIPQG